MRIFPEVYLRKGMRNVRGAPKKTTMVRRNVRISNEVIVEIEFLELPERRCGVFPHFVDNFSTRGQIVILGEVGENIVASSRGTRSLHSVRDSLGISVRSELRSVFFCHAICPWRERNQLIKTLAALGWGARLMRTMDPAPELLYDYDTSLGLKVPKYSEVKQLIRFYLAFNPIAGAVKPKNLFEVSIRWNSSRIEKLANRSQTSECRGP